MILAFEIVKLNPRILPREIHKLLGFENSINFVNEKNSGDVNIDLNQNFVRDSLVQWRRLFVLQMDYIEKPKSHVQAYHRSLANSLKVKSKRKSTIKICCACPFNF